MSEKLLEIKDVYVKYTSKGGFSGKTKTVYAVNGATFDVNKGEILAVAGESGCGKSTLAKAIMSLVKSCSGSIVYMGKDVSELKGLNDFQKFYKNVQIIFQNPYSSLNPKMKIREILCEPLDINTKYSEEEKNNIILDVLFKTGLDESCLDKYPHEFSGGQRQRIAISRALVLNPEFIIADEPVSALDVSIQAQIINLLKDLRDKMNLTFLFISHDLRVIKYISDRIAIMYLGEVVEIGNTEEIFSNPKHPYTKALLSAVPQINQSNSDKSVNLSGELPSPENLPQGCKFHTRCPFVMDECKSREPENVDFGSGHLCRCLLYKQNSVI